MMIWFVANAGSARTRSQRLGPSSSGIIQSTMTRSGRSRSIAARPAAPSAASSTRYPIFFSRPARLRRATGSSSIKRMTAPPSGRPAEAVRSTGSCVFVPIARQRDQAARLPLSDTASASELYTGTSFWMLARFMISRT